MISFKFYCYLGRDSFPRLSSCPK